MNFSDVAPFEVTVWFDGDCAVLALEGELDIYSAPRLRNALLDAYEKAAGAPLRLVVDLAKLRFMDSTGLGTLVAGLKRAAGSAGAMVLCAVPESIARTLRITGLTRVLLSFGTIEEAMAFLASRPSIQ